jgi:hypothetical protein
VNLVFVVLGSLTRNTLESNAKNSNILIAYPVRDCASKDRIYL